MMRRAAILWWKRNQYQFWLVAPRRTFTCPTCLPLRLSRSVKDPHNTINYQTEHRILSPTWNCRSGFSGILARNLRLAVTKGFNVLSRWGVLQVVWFGFKGAEFCNKEAELTTRFRVTALLS